MVDVKFFTANDVVQQPSVVVDVDRLERDVEARSTILLRLQRFMFCYSARACVVQCESNEKMREWESET